MQTEPVVRLRGTVTGPNAIDWTDPSALTLQTLAPVQLIPAAEAPELDEAAGTAYKVYLDQTADVVLTDRLIIRGETYEVDGIPEVRTGFALVVRTAALEQLYDCQVTIAPPGRTPVFDSVSRVTTTTPAAATYTGPAGVVALSRTSTGPEPEPAGDDVVVTPYEVRLPRVGSELVTTGQVVTVVDALDPALVGRQLWITSVELNPSGQSRVLRATVND